VCRVQLRERLHAISVITEHCHLTVCAATFSSCMHRKRTFVIHVGLHWQVELGFGLIDRRLTVLQCSTFVSLVNLHMPRMTALFSSLKLKQIFVLSVLSHRGVRTGITVGCAIGRVYSL